MRLKLMACLGICLVLSMLPGCSSASRTSGIAGTYVNRDNVSDKIVLKSDGTFTFTSSSNILGIGDRGTYKLDGNLLKLRWATGYEATATIDENGITFPTISGIGNLYGSRWIRR